MSVMLTIKHKRFVRKMDASFHTTCKNGSIFALTWKLFFLKELQIDFNWELYPYQDIPTKCESA